LPFKAPNPYARSLSMGTERLAYVLLSAAAAATACYQALRFFQFHRALASGLEFLKEGRAAEAERVLSSVPPCRESNARALPVAAMCRHNLAVALLRQRKYPEAFSVIDEVVHYYANRSPDNPHMLNALLLLARVLYKLGRYEEIVTPLKRARDFTDEHVDASSRAADIRIKLGVAYMRVGRYNKALEYLLPAAERERQSTSADRTTETQARFSLGALYLHRGNLVEAESIQEEVLATRLTESGRGDVKTLQVITNTAWLRLLQGKYDEAEALAMEVAAAAQGYEWRANSLHTLAILFTRSNRFEEAGELFSRVRQERRREFPDDHPELAKLQCDLATLRMGQGKVDAADDLLRSAREMLEAKLAGEHPLIGLVLFRTGQLRVKQGRPIEAKPLLESALAIYERTAPQHPDAVECRRALEALDI